MNAQSKLRPHLTMTSREFNQQTGKAKAAAESGPVIITDRGKPAYVLLSNEEFERLNRPVRSAFDSIADMRPEADFDFEFERAPGKAREVDFGFDD